MQEQYFQTRQKYKLRSGTELFTVVLLCRMIFIVREEFKEEVINSQNEINRDKRKQVAAPK